MFDRSAAIKAAREVVETAPTIDSVDTPVFDFRALVEAVLRAANPDALIVPAYDEQLAQGARYRLEQDTEIDPNPANANAVRTIRRGACMSVTAHPGAVAVGVYSGRPNDTEEAPTDRVLVSGLVGSDAAWHLGLALCSASVASSELQQVRG